MCFRKGMLNYKAPKTGDETWKNTLEGASVDSNSGSPRADTAL